MPSKTPDSGRFGSIDRVALDCAEAPGQSAPPAPPEAASRLPFLDPPDARVAKEAVTERIPPPPNGVGAEDVLAAHLTPLEELVPPEIERFFALDADPRLLERDGNLLPSVTALDFARNELLPACRQASEAVARSSAPSDAMLENSGVAKYLSQRQATVDAMLKAADEKNPRVVNFLWELTNATSRGKQALARLKATRQVEFRAALGTFKPRLWGTPVLIALCALVYLAMAVAGETLAAPDVLTRIRWGANFGPKTLGGEWWRLLSYQFLHAGFWHLALNMWALWVFAGMVERLVGNVGFVLLYLVAGVFGGLASVAWNPTVVSVGASGAVFGVAGALGALLLRMQWQIPEDISDSLKKSVLAFICYNLFGGMLVPHIDVACHLGGLAAGFFGGLVLSRPLGDERLAARLKRNAAFLALTAAALAVSGVFLPPAPIDPVRAFQEWARGEADVLAAYGEIVKLAQSNTLSDDAFAERLEQKVLAPWKTMRDRVREVGESPLADKPLWAKLDHYMDLRERSWRQLADALRQHDETMAAASRKIGQEADQAAADITAELTARATR